MTIGDKQIAFRCKVVTPSNSFTEECSMSREVYGKHGAKCFSKQRGEGNKYEYTFTVDLLPSGHPAMYMHIDPITKEKTLRQIYPYKEVCRGCEHSCLTQYNRPLTEYGI